MKKKPVICFLNLGNQISIPAASCMTPNIVQTVDGMLPINVQGGSKKKKNLSSPIIKKEKLQNAVIIFAIFILVYLIVL